MEKALLFKGGKVFCDTGEFRQAGLLIKNGKIEKLIHDGEDIPGAQVIDCTGRYITPGFIDIHIHGREGYDAADNVAEVAKRLPKHGVTSFMPTTLTRSLEETLETLKKFSDYIENQPGKGAEAVGIYSEGMYFSREKAGAQNPEFIRDRVDIAELEQLIDAGNGHLKVVALAPEKDNSVQGVKFLCERGIIPSMAHTMALYSDVKRCVDAGLKGVTHTFNGMRGMTHLELGASGGAVFTDSLCCELITDGFHVNKEFINILFRFKPLDKIIFISDNVGASGTPAGKYKLGGLPIINKGDRLVVDNDNGVYSLAGSCLRLCDSIKNVHKFTGLPYESLIPCATVNPARYIGVYDRKGSLTPGKDADINIFDENFDLRATCVKGLMEDGSYDTAL